MTPNLDIVEGQKRFENDKREVFFLNAQNSTDTCGRLRSLVSYRTFSHDVTEAIIV